MEAVNFRLDPDSDAYEAQICPEDLEYLAELIVRECAGVELYWLGEQDRKAVAEKIKEHFGVDISS